MPAFALRPEWVPLLRLVYLLLAFVITWGGVRLRRPSQLELRAAIVAAGGQLILAVLLDAAGQALGLWHYAVGDGLLLGVPLDLHLAWALPWGILFVLWAPRGSAAAWRYAAVWWAATITYDALLAPVSAALVTRGAGLGWLVGDAVMIAGLLLAAQSLYRAVWRSGQTLSGGPVAAEELARLRRGAAVRAGLYLLVFGALSFGLLPYLILMLTGRSGWPPAQPTVILWLVGAGMGLCLLWPLWAVQEFVRAGGTPLPFDPPLALVVSGPYRFVRNPMQVGAITALVGLAGLYRSWGLLVYAVDLVLLSQLLFLPQEEAELSRRFGPAYDHYRAAVRCWLPRLSPYRAAEELPLRLEYDQRCPACADAVARLQQILPGGPQAFLTEPLPPGAVGLRVQEPRRPGEPALIHHGLDAWLALLGRGPLYLAWVVPLVALPPLRALLRVCYQASAERRPHRRIS